MSLFDKRSGPAGASTSLVYIGTERMRATPNPAPTPLPFRHVLPQPLSKHDTPKSNDTTNIPRPTEHLAAVETSKKNRSGGARRPPREPEALAPGTAVFKPRVVRFVLPRVFCHASGLPAGALLKVRTEPGGAEGVAGGRHALEESAAGGGGGGDGAGGSHVLGRVGADQCVIALATSGDWLQVSRSVGWSVGATEKEHDRIRHLR